MKKFQAQNVSTFHLILKLSIMEVIFKDLLLYRDLVDDATICFNKAIELDETFGDSYYNKSCVESLKGYKTNAINFLEQAFNLNGKSKNEAKSDTDFDNIRESKYFKELIGE